VRWDWGSTIAGMTAKKNETNGTKSRPVRGRSGGRPVRLGHVAPNGIGASLCGLVELGTTKRPQLARDLRGTVELRFREDFAPVRMNFASDGILVEDAGEQNGWDPELVISGSLPDIIKLTAAPSFGGLPKLTDARGRAAFASMAGGKIKIDGSAVLARRLLKLLEL
jgi:hypothetical protein